VLLDRAGECARVLEVLARARQGVSDVLVVRGEAGMGKTALLGYAVSEALDMRVVSAAAAAGESGLPFACLHRLLGGLMEAVLSIPQVQRDALLGALAVGPPARLEDRFAVHVAVLSLVGVVADAGPVLIAVDDAQWLDHATAEILGFVVRRLGAEGVAVLLACRDDQMPPQFAEFSAVRLQGLAPTAIEELLTDRLGGRPSPGLVGRLAEASGGNPLILVEVAAQLTADQAAGRAGVDELVLAARTGPARLLVRRLDGTGEETRQAAVLAAAAGEDELAEVLAAARRCGIADRAFEDLEDRGVISLEQGTLRFMHPVMRVAVTEAAAPREIRAAHRALAGAAGPGGAESRAWHLGAAALEPDEGLARILESAAETASARSGYAAAAAALTRAAELSESDAMRSRRRFAAAQAARLAGQNDVARRLLEQVTDGTDPSLLAAVASIRGRLELREGKLAVAYAVLSDASAAAADDPATAAALLADAAMVSFLAGDPVRAVELALQAGELDTPPDSNSDLLVKLIVGTAYMHLGQLTEGLRLVRDAARIAGLPPGRRPDMEYVIFTALGLVWLGDHDAARELLAPIVAELRARGALGDLPFALYAAAYADARAGRLGAAVAAAAEGAGLAEATGDQLWRYLGLGALALAEAQLGDEASCRQHAEAALMMLRRLDLDYPRDATDALGLLELGLGNAERAISYLEPANQIRGSAPVLARPSATDLVEAYVRAGRPVPHMMAEGLVRQSGDEEFPGNAAIAWRCRGLIAADDQYQACFERALSLHDRGSSPFETARTQFCFGERLRRSGRRADAREHLRAAHLIFDQLGARLLAGRAGQELRATGEIPHRPAGPASVAGLTPQERAVAAAIARGHTNREAATMLFLSPKTIEMHLSRVYRKLGLRSRAELASRFATAEHAWALG
jgi:DNA-binding CsgD family transcriptional regulator